MGDEETLDSLLTSLEKVKKVGTPCPVREARTFYLEMTREMQDRVNVSVGEYLINNSQSIPFTKLNSDILDEIEGDENLMLAQIGIYGELRRFVKDVYKKPSDYNAWKKEIEIPYEEDGFSKVERDNVYFIEPKNVEKTTKDNEGIYI